jgi:hypothetical protein
MIYDSQGRLIGSKVGRSIVNRINHGGETITTKRALYMMHLPPRQVAFSQGLLEDAPTTLYAPYRIDAPAKKRTPHSLGVEIKVKQVHRQ